MVVDGAVVGGIDVGATVAGAADAAVAGAEPEALASGDLDMPEAWQADSTSAVAMPRVRVACIRPLS
jgi:hypothetical protein